METPRKNSRKPRERTPHRSSKEKRTRTRRKKASRSSADMSVETSKMSNTKLAKVEAEGNSNAGDELFFVGADFHQNNGIEMESAETIAEDDEINNDPLLTGEKDEQSALEAPPHFPDSPTGSSSSIKTEIFPTSNVNLHVNASDEKSVSTSDSKESELEKNSRFEMMDVTVTIIGLSGILVSTPNNPPKKPKNKKLSLLQNSPKSVALLRGGFSSVPTTSSLGSESMVPENPISEDTEVLALVSFTQNAGKSRVPVSSYISSLPLKDPARKSPQTWRYNAKWPKKLQSPNHLEGTSSYSFQVPLEKDSLSIEQEETEEYSSQQQQEEDIKQNFIPELLEMQVGVMVEGKMEILGDTTLLISSECSHVELSLPLHHQIKKKDIRSKLQRLKKLNPSKKMSTIQNPKTRYHLDDNSSLLVSLNVSPKNVKEKKSHKIENPCIEIGTDNVATLWKIAPHDEFEVVEYTPPREDDSNGDEKDENFVEKKQKQPNNKNKKSKGNRGTLYQQELSRTPSLLDENEKAPSSSPYPPIQPPPQRKSSPSNFWYCLNPALSLCEDDEHLIFSESMVSDIGEDEYYLNNDSKTWDGEGSQDFTYEGTANGADDLFSQDSTYVKTTNQEDDDESQDYTYTQNDEDESRTNTNTRNNDDESQEYTYGGNTTGGDGEESSENETYDDTYTSTTGGSKGLSLNSASLSLPDPGKGAKNGKKSRYGVSPKGKRNHSSFCRPYRSRS